MGMRVVVMAALGLLVGAQGAWGQSRAPGPTPQDAQYRDPLIQRAWELALTSLYRRGCASGRDAMAADRIESNIRTHAQRAATTEERRGILQGAQVGIERELLERFRTTQGEGRVNFTSLCDYLEPAMLGMALRHIQEP